MSMTGIRKDATRRSTPPTVDRDAPSIETDRGREDRDAGTAMELPGQVEQTSEVVKQVSVEGRPAEADARAGPARIMLDMVLAMLVIVVLALIAGAAFGPLVGLLCLVIGALAMALNPVMGASVMRIEDRAEASRRLRERQD